MIQLQRLQTGDPTILDRDYLRSGQSSKTKDDEGRSCAKMTLTKIEFRSHTRFGYAFEYAKCVCIFA